MVCKFSPWFKCSEHKPVHVGYYEWKPIAKSPVDHEDFWNGTRWETDNGLEYDAEFQTQGYWRGLTK